MQKIQIRRKQKSHTATHILREQLCACNHYSCERRRVGWLGEWLVQLVGDLPSWLLAWLIDCNTTHTSQQRSSAGQQKENHCCCCCCLRYCFAHLFVCSVLSLRCCCCYYYWVLCGCVLSLRLLLLVWLVGAMTPLRVDPLTMLFLRIIPKWVCGESGPLLG